MAVLESEIIGVLATLRGYKSVISESNVEGVDHSVITVDRIGGRREIFGYNNWRVYDQWRVVVHFQNQLTDDLLDRAVMDVWNAISTSSFRDKLGIMSYKWTFVKVARGNWKNVNIVFDTLSVEGM